MTTMERNSRNSRNGWFWVPTLYFAEGLPAALITTVSLVMFSNLSLSERFSDRLSPEQVLFWTGLFSLPWRLRPLWVPVIDRIGTPRGWAVALQAVMGGLFAAAGAAVAFGAWLTAIGCCFLAAAVASATHDAAADGFYIIALDASAQAEFSGIRSAVYKAGTVVGQGLLTMFGGWLCTRLGLSVEGSWGWVYASAGAAMVLLAFYHLVMMPIPSRPAAGAEKSAAPKESLLTFFAPYWRVVRAPGFGRALAFLLLFRLAESQLRVAVPFLLAKRADGGMELSVVEQGFLYGTCGALALIAGGILSGYAVSRQGMRRWLWPMALAINVPDLVYVYLAWARPASLRAIGGCVFIEQFGYGFGFTLLTLGMVLMARGEGGHETTRFALFTAISLFGVMAPGSVAGYLLKIPALLFPGLDRLACYRIFFLWVMVCTIPSFLVTALMAKFLCNGFPPPVPRCKIGRTADSECASDTRG